MTKEHNLKFHFLGTTDWSLQIRSFFYLYLFFAGYVKGYFFIRYISLQVNLQVLGAHMRFGATFNQPGKGVERFSQKRIYFCSSFLFSPIATTVPFFENENPFLRAMTIIARISTISTAQPLGEVRAATGDWLAFASWS